MDLGSKCTAVIVTSLPHCESKSTLSFNLGKLEIYLLCEFNKGLPVLRVQQTAHGGSTSPPELSELFFQPAMSPDPQTTQVLQQSVWSIDIQIAPSEHPCS